MSSLQLLDREPFVYVIKHISSGKRYCGVKFSKGCSPSDMLTTYFTSSKIIKQMISDGEEFIIDIIIVCDSKDDAIELEEFILTEANAHLSDEWFNQAIGKAINPDTVKVTCLAKYGVDNWMKSENAKGLGFKQGNTYGCFNRTDETKLRMSEAFKGRIFSNEHKEKIRQNRLGTKMSEEVRNKMSENRTRGKHPRAVPINTPDGVFECFNDAADFYGISGKGIARRISSPNFPEYYKIKE